MIKIEWFSEEMQNEYTETIAKKIREKLKKEILKFPDDIAELFREKGSVSEQKIKEFLKMKFYNVENNKALNHYISRCTLISHCLTDINKSDFNKWKKTNSLKVISDYLDERFEKYNKKYQKNYPLTYPTDASGNNWSDNFKKKIIKTVLLEPFKTVFNYDIIKDELRHKLMNSLNVPVCPYCNRQYITPWDDMEGNKKSTADLDHFFPQSEYPLFALNLFNFVPSCQVCNSRMKLSRFLDKNGNRPIYPYDENFGDDAVFKASTTYGEDDPKRLLEVWLSESIDDLKITLKIQDNIDEQYKDKIEQSNNLYHIEKVYQAHKNYVSELMLKKRIYDDGEYFKTIQNIFSGFERKKLNQFSEDVVYNINGKKLTITKKQLELFLYGYNWENGQDSTRPLSKLTYDILKR